jgi:hypothetical protein
MKKGVTVSKHTDGYQVIVVAAHGRGKWKASVEVAKTRSEVRDVITRAYDRAEAARSGTS